MREGVQFLYVGPSELLTGTAAASGDGFPALRVVNQGVVVAIQHLAREGFVAPSPCTGHEVQAQ